VSGSAAGARDVIAGGRADVKDGRGAIARTSFAKCCRRQHTARKKDWTLKRAFESEARYHTRGRQRSYISTHTARTQFAWLSIIAMAAISRFLQGASRDKKLQLSTIIRNSSGLVNIESNSFTLNKNWWLFKIKSFAILRQKY